MDVSVYQKPLLSRTFITLITIVHVFCGLDSGFVKLLSKKWGTVLKLIAITFSVTIAWFLSKPILNYDIGLFYYLSFSTEYLTFTTILFFSNYTLNEFLLEFDELWSRTLNRKVLRDVVLRSVLVPFLSVSFKFVMSVAYCVYSDSDVYCSQPFIEQVMKVVSAFAFDILLLVQFSIMYTYYRHMNLLKSKVFNHEIDALSVLKTYKGILDAVDKIKPTFDKLIMSNLIIAVPRYIVTEYMVLHELKFKPNWVWLLQIVIVLEMGLLRGMAAIAAEAANTQADKIVLTLHNNLIVTSDSQKRFEIKETVRYMSARPSQCYVWRRIPVDGRLPMAVVSIITTYLIVVIQFTHLFD